MSKCNNNNCECTKNYMNDDTLFFKHMTEIIDKNNKYEYKTTYLMLPEMSCSKIIQKYCNNCIKRYVDKNTEKLTELIINDNNYAAIVFMGYYMKFNHKLNDALTYFSLIDCDPSALIEMASLNTSLKKYDEAFDNAKHAILQNYAFGILTIEMISMFTGQYKKMLNFLIELISEHSVSDYTIYRVLIALVTGSLSEHACVSLFDIYKIARNKPQIVNVLNNYFFGRFNNKINYSIVFDKMSTQICNICYLETDCVDIMDQYLCSSCFMENEYLHQKIK